jgi:hypothetical protein
LRLKQGGDVAGEKQLNQAWMDEVAIGNQMFSPEPWAGM